MNDFEAIVESYLPAAQVLMLSRAHVAACVFNARRLGYRCESCRYSRAPYNAEQIARARGVLPIYERRCTRRGVYRTCPDWQEIEIPAEFLEVEEGQPCCEDSVADHPPNPKFTINSIVGRREDETCS